LCVV